MHKLTMDFLQEQYKKTKLLRSSSKGEVWLVTQADDIVLGCLAGNLFASDSCILFIKQESYIML